MNSPSSSSVQAGSAERSASPPSSSTSIAAAPGVETPVVEVCSLVHRYGDRVALDDVSFHVGAAEIFGLLGPNGSGKTTLFRILSTLMLPSGGAAAIRQHDVARDPLGVRRAIGIVHQ